MLKKALTTLAVAAFVAGFAAPASAGIVDCTTSSATGGGFYDLCPLGDAQAVSLSLTLLDFFNNPVVGVDADSIEVVCPGVVGFPLATPDDLKADADTDGAGQTTITFSRGGFNSDGYCNDLGVTIRDGVNTCVLDVATRAGLTIKFFDLTGDGIVGPADYGSFGLHWNTSDPECDYDESGTVGPADYGSFGLHWSHNGQ